MKPRLDHVLLVILAVGLALRLPNLGYSFYGDEAFSVLRDSDRLLTTSEDRFRPVFFSLLYVWRQIGFSGEAGLRMLPLLFGVAQIPAAYSAGKRLGSRSLAVTFSALVAVSPMLIEFSQELRMYSLVAFLALVQVLIFLRLRERSTWGWWAAFVLVTLAGVYTHLHYWLFVAGLSLSLFRERRAIPLRQSALALAIGVLLYLPNLPNIMRFSQIRGADYVVHLPSALPKLAAAVTVGFNYFSPPIPVLGRVVGVADVFHDLPLSLLAAVPAVLLLWGLVRLHRVRPLSGGVWLAHELFTIPVLLALIASAFTGQYWLQPKYIVFVVPFALLLMALAGTALPWRWLRGALVAASGVVLVIAYVHFLNPQLWGRRENWRDLAAHLRANSRPASALLVLSGPHALLEYYWPEATALAQPVRVPRTAGGVTAFSDDIAARLEEKREVWYVWHDVRRNLDDPRDLMLLALDNVGGNRREMSFNPRLRLYHWTLPD